MAKRDAKPKQGPLSASRPGGPICQEVRSSKTQAVVLEVRALSGEIIFAHPLPDQTFRHQISPDGRFIFALTGGERGEVGLTRRLIRIAVGSGETVEIGPANSAPVAVDDTRIAYCRGRALVVETHDGTRRLTRPVEDLSEWHACALLPDDGVALSRGHRASEKIADLTVLNVADGRVRTSIELPVDTAYSVFAASKLCPAPDGTRIAILGHYRGLLLIDLPSGRDLAESRAPDPLDLADGRPTTHSHHTYSDVAFDRGGRLMAAAYGPGKVSVWSWDGAVIARAWIATNPKASRIVAFDDGDAVFFDSMGATGRTPIGTPSP